MSDLNGLSMAPAELANAMQLLADTGTRFGSEWEGHNATIGAGEGGIGGDRIAAAFRPNYQPAADSLKQAARSIAGAFGVASAAGTASAMDYVSADSAAAQRFGSIEGPALARP